MPERNQAIMTTATDIADMRARAESDAARLGTMLTDSAAALDRAHAAHRQLECAYRIASDTLALWRDKA